MSTQELLKIFVKKGFLLDRETLDFFASLEDITTSEDILNKISMLSKGRVVSKEIMAKYYYDIKPFFEILAKEKKPLVVRFFSELDIGIQTSPKEEGVSIISENLPSVKVLSSNIIPDRKIEVKDFITHFKNRYGVLRDILKERKELENLTSIDKIGSSKNTVSIIGLVFNKRITKNNNILIEIEDPTGRRTALVNQSKPELLEKAKDIVMDDVIGLKCTGGGELLYVNDIFFPDSLLEQKTKLDEEAYAVFTSDIHIGSRNFLEENFQRFINWLNGRGVDEEQKKKISKIRYLFIVGDSVDGVGIFPGQEEELVIKNVRDQYKRLAYFFDQIPKHISIIMCPGQHDAVRVPEPQPPVDEEFAEEIVNMENVYLVSNPSFIEVGATAQKKGVRVLMYHGASFHGWNDEIEELRMINGHHHPAKIVRQVLKHRHLAPIHSSTTYVPDSNEDPLLIKETPDIILTGDLHKPDIDMYNNVLIICSSCWQSITPFEEKVGNIPDPCKVPLLNLKTRELKIMDFSLEAQDNTEGELEVAKQNDN